jgi:hypothetical protein
MGLWQSEEPTISSIVYIPSISRTQLYAAESVPDNSKHALVDFR